MPKGLINESSLNSIAEAINVLNGSEGTYLPSEIEYKVDLNSYIQKLIDEASTQASLSVSPLSLGKSAVLTSTDGEDGEEIKPSEDEAGDLR